jgi:hypothetical protein
MPKAASIASTGSGVTLAKDALIAGNARFSRSLAVLSSSMMSPVASLASRRGR